MALFDDPKAEPARPFWPHHAMLEVIWALVMVALIFTLATFVSAPQEPPADPYITPPHIKPEWYFLAAYQWLKVCEGLGFLGEWAPKTIGVLGQGVAIGVLFFLPWLDRNKTQRSPRNRPIAMAVFALSIIGFIVMTLWGHYS